MKTLFLFLALTPLAFAAEKENKSACREGKSFYNQIYNCGQNKIAAKYAEKCSNATLAASKVAGSLLAAQMAAMQKDLGTAQTANMNDAVDRLRRAINAIEIQILAMQKHTAMIADYPKVMIDYPGAEDDETSAGCFSPSFHKIQDIVSNLDQEIVRAKAARSQAQDFLQTLAVSSGDMSDLTKTRVPASSGKAAPASPTAPKGKSWNASDISGTKPDPKQK